MCVCFPSPFVHCCIIGQDPQAAPDPEALVAGHVHLYAGQRALSEGPDPGHLFIETGTAMHV